jgi:hypothetical protein
MLFAVSLLSPSFGTTADCPSVGPDNVRVTTALGGSRIPTVAFNDQVDEFGVAWRDVEQTSKILFARLNPTCGRLGGPSDVLVTDPAAVPGQKPDMVWGGDRYGLAWDDARHVDPSNSFNTYFAALEPDGTRICQRRITEDTRSEDVHVAWSGVNFGLTWFDYRFGNPEIFFVLVDPNCSEVSAETQLTDNPEFSGISAVAWNPTVAEFGVVFRDLRDSPGDLWFVRVSSSGAKIGQEVKIVSSTGRAFLPALAALPAIDGDDPGYGITWVDERDGGNQEIYFALFDPNGVRQTPDTNISGFTAEESRRPDITWTGSEFVVSWQEGLIGDPSGPEVFIARIATNGVKICEQRVSDSDPTESAHPTVAWSGTHVGVMWQDRRDGPPNDQEIYCAGILPECGDGVRDPGEDCDGTEIGGTCQSEGFDCGTLACGPDCTFDTTACESSPCFFGQTRCLDATTQQTCGNYDADACLEWGGDFSCPAGCAGVSCVGCDCGDNVLQPECGEECDGSDATACPGRCQIDCTCIPCTPQTRRQQNCLNAINRNLLQVASKQGKEILDCLRKGSRELITDIEACIVADSKNRVGRATTKTTSDYQKKCTTDPPCFGLTDPNTVNDAAIQKELDLVHDIFGDDLNTAIAVLKDDRFTARCQQRVMSKVKKCQDTKLREFNKCKKAALKDSGSPAVGEADLEACMFVDPGSKVTRACVEKVNTQVQKACVAKGVDLQTAFPGAGTGDPAALVDALDQTVECLACIAVNAADGLARDCDQVDDGQANGSCP